AEGAQVCPAVSLFRRVRDQGALLAKVLEPRLEPAHRSGRTLDDERNVLQGRLIWLGRVAGGEPDVGAARKGSRHLDDELLKHLADSPSAFDYTGVNTFNGNSRPLLQLSPGNGPANRRHRGC